MFLQFLASGAVTVLGAQMLLCTFSCIRHRMPVGAILNWLAGIALIKCVIAVGETRKTAVAGIREAFDTLPKWTKMRKSAENTNRMKKPRTRNGNENS